MAADLSTENRQLRRDLKALLAQARQNERKLQRFHEQELRLMCAASLAELIQILLYDYPRTFELDAVTLALVDADYELRRILDSMALRCEDYPTLLFMEARSELEALFDPAPRAWLGPYRREQHGSLFAHGAPPVSVAVLPLLRRGELIGSFNLGSRAEQRFIRGTATDFLERMAGVVAVCLENATNQERLKHLGFTDALTGVHNRRYFDQRLEEEIDRAERQPRPLACIFVDIDHFKHINDDHGHQVGDRVLREIARRIKTHMRASDILARYGGEEFAVLLAGSEQRDAVEIAQRIRATVAAQPVPLADGTELRVTLSAGVSALSNTPHGADRAVRARQLLDRADRALYAAKAGGRNRVAADNGE